MPKRRDEPRKRRDEPRKKRDTRYLDAWKQPKKEKADIYFKTRESERERKRQRKEKEKEKWMKQEN